MRRVRSVAAHRSSREVCVASSSGLDATSGRNHPQEHLSNGLVQKFIRNNLRKGKYKWAILTNDRGSANQGVEPGGYRAIDLAAPPFAVRCLVDLPIKFGKATTKITSLLDLTLHR
jgi:hypothetical protein